LEGKGKRRIRRKKGGPVCKIIRNLRHQTDENGSWWLLRTMGGHGGNFTLAGSDI